MNRAWLLVVGALALASLPLAAQEPTAQGDDPYASLIGMQKSGLSEVVLLEWVRSQQADGVKFEPTPQQLIDLKAAGIPDSILTQMLQRPQVAQAPQPSVQPGKRPPKVRITACLTREPNLHHSWSQRSFLYHGSDPLKKQGLEILWYFVLKHDLTDVSGKLDLRVIPLKGVQRESVCWYSRSGGTLRLPGECTAVYASGSPDYDANLSSSYWRTLFYDRPVTVIDTEFPEECWQGKGACFLSVIPFVAWSVYNESVLKGLPRVGNDGELKPFQLFINSQGSTSFEAEVPIEIATDGQSEFEVRMTNLAFHDFDENTAGKPRTASPPEEGSDFWIGSASQSYPGSVPFSLMVQVNEGQSAKRRVH